MNDRNKRVKGGLEEMTRKKKQKSEGRFCCSFDTKLNYFED
jgi:hypothetical protein